MSKYADLSKEELLRIVEKQEEELKSKKYGLVWDNEKEPEKVVLDCENNLPILKKISEKDINTDKKEDNILIEGDNYHALTVLNYTHKEKVDLIYVDPPYNTGKTKEWAYNDKFIDINDGYRHSKWLNMMEKRLKLAKNLLNKNGSIFISIDDNEVAQLKLLCNSIFGEYNFIAQINRIQSRGKNNGTHFNNENDYILVYAKDKTLFSVKKATSSINENLYKYEDEEGKRKKRPFEMQGTDVHLGNRKLLGYSVYVHPDTNDIKILYDYNLDEKEIYKTPDKKLISDGYSCFRPRASKKGHGIRRRNEERVKKDKKQLFFDFKENRVYLKDRFKEEIDIIPGTNIEIPNTGGTLELQDMFGEKPFDYPKPTKLIERILERIDNTNLIILDFFAGSGTTGHAVLKYNNKDKGNRRFILCTNNELNGIGSQLAEKNPSKDKETFGVCQRVTYPRLKKAIQGYKKSGDGEFIEGLGGNLKYFQTNFIKKTSSRDQVKFDLTNKCTEMLCVKDNIFNLEKEAKNYKIFTSNDKKRFLCIYYSFIKDEIDSFIKELKGIKEEKNIYMFSETKEVDLEIFKDIKNCNIEAIPEPILEIYRELIKMNISK